MEEITLRPITLSDTDLIVKWRNSDAVRLNMFDQRILTAEQHRNYFHQYIKTGIIVQYIIDVDTLPVGTVFYKKKDCGIVELGLFIGEKEKRGKGYGRTALSKVLYEVKNDSSIKSIRIIVKESNKKALSLYEDMGFSYKGIFSSSFIEMEIV